MISTKKAWLVILITVYHHATAQISTKKDKQGNSYTIKAMPDNKLWITQNLNIEIPESYCYNDSAKYCRQYGRLYTWKAAQEVCPLLGAGWRLPTNEEWRHQGR